MPFPLRTRFPFVARLSVVRGLPYRAVQDNGEQMRAALDRLEDLGGVKSGLQADSFNFSPEWSHSQSNEPRIIGYFVSRSQHVELSDDRMLGRQAIDSVVGLCVRRIDGNCANISESGPLLEEAKSVAVEDDRARSLLCATSAGLHLGRILRFAKTPSPVEPLGGVFSTQAGPEAVSVMPFVAGEHQIHSRVFVTSSLEGKNEQAQKSSA